MLGELELELGGDRAELPHSRRAREVLAWLALHPGLHPRSRLAARFWPDVLDSSARASLRSAIWALRSALGPDAGAFVVADRESVGLRDDGLWVDAREFGRLAAAGHLDEAVALCRDEMLYQFDDEWVFELRDEHSRRLAAALEGLAAQAERSGDLRAAVRWTRRRTALDPLDEEAGRDLIRRLADSGDVAGALAAYSRLGQRVRSELGVAVSADTRRMVEELHPLVPAVGDDSLRPPIAEPAARMLPLVGRGHELGLLKDAWKRARAGSGTAVVLIGEGGIGKTRLVEELLDEAEREGALSLACAAVELGGGLPFGLWSELLRDLVGELDALPEDRSWMVELARLVPALERRPADAPIRPGAQPELERTRLFEAVVELLGWASRERPLALALEDLHLADPSSLALLGYAGRRIRRVPVLLVLTRRALPPRPEVDVALGALRSRGTLTLELELEPLPSRSARDLAHAAAELSESAVEQVVAVAGGSPLLTVEAARAMARGDPPSAGLRGAVRSSTGSLGEQARLFIELAAVAGRDLTRDEAVALPLVADPARAATEALGTGLLRAREARIGFRHALLREAVYDDLPDPRRAELHESLAHALRRSGPRRGSRHAADIARHLRLAGRHELAAGQLARAAADARAVAALPEAAAFLREAVEIASDDPDLLIELAEVEAWRGLLGESDSAFERGLERVPHGDTGALVSAWLRRGRWLRGGVCHPRESRRSYRNALEALDRDPAADPLARAEALAGLAWAESVAGDPAAAEELLRRVSEITGREPGTDLLAHDVGVARGHALLRAGRFAESYGPLIAASTAAGRSGRPDMAYTCLINASSAAACAGDFTRALEFADRCLPLVVPNGLLRLGVYTQSARAGILRRLGRLSEADSACAAAAELADRLGIEELEALVHHDRGVLSLVTGDPERAAAELALALERAAPVSRPLTRLHRAEALARCGRLDAAEAELRSVALEPVSPSDFPDTLVARMAWVQGLIALRRGQPVVAERRLREAAEGWRRRTRRAGDPGEEYVTTLVDLGRPPVSVLVEPERELERVSAELERLAGRLAGDRIAT